MKIYRDCNHRSEVYRVLLESTGCGPFDGGCLAVAKALTLVHGGQVGVIEGRRGSLPLTALHAVALLPGGLCVDADGAATAEQVMARFVRNEVPGGAFGLAVRPIEEGDLPDAPADEALVKRLARLLMLPVMPQKAGRMSRPSGAVV